jgi:outer membrane protein insertion porin family
MSTTPESVAPRRPWRKRLLRLAALLLVLLIVLGLGVGLYLRSKRFSRLVADQIEKGARDYGLRVEVGEFGYRWALKTARLHDLQIYNQQTGQLIATIKLADLTVSLPDLYALKLQRQVVFEKLALDGVDLRVELDEQGRSNFADLRQPEKKSERIKVDSAKLQVTLKQSKLSFNDQQHHFALALEGLEGQVTPEDQISSLKSKITANGGSLSYEGRSTPVQSLTATATHNSSGAEIENLKLVSGLGEVSARGKLEDWKALRYGLDVEAQTDLVEVLRVFAPNVQMKGRGGARGQVEGTTGENAQVAFKGNAEASDLQVENARLRNASVNAVDVLIAGGKVNFAGERARADTVFVETARLGGASLASFKGEFKDGQMSMATPAASAARVEWPGGQARDAVVRGVNFTLKDKRFTADGAVAIAGGSANKLQFGRVTAQAKVNNELLTATNIQASALEGTVRGEATAQLARNGVTRAKVSFADLATGKLLALTPYTTEQMPLSGKVQGTADISFVNSAPQRLSGMINAKFEGKGDERIDALPVNGDVSVQADRGTFNIRQLQLSTDVTRLTASGSVSLDGNSDLRVALNSSEASQLLTIAKAVPEAERYIREYEPLLTGNLEFNGRLTGKLEQPVIEGDVTAASVGMRDALLGSVTAKLYVAPNELRVQTGVLNASNGGTLKFDLATPLGEVAPNTGKLDLVVDKLELEAVLAAVGSPSLMEFVTGNVSGEAHLTGLPKAMQGSGRFNLIDGTIAKQAAELAQVDFKLDGQKVLLEKLEARLLQSALVASGQLDLEKKTYQASGEAKQIALNRLVEAFELTTAQVTGTADATFNASGSLDKVEDLKLELTAQGQTILVNGRNTGDLKLTARTDASGRLDAELTTGILAATGGQPQLIRASIELRREGRPISIESDLNNVELAAVLNLVAPDLASTFVGKLNGKLRITGPTVNERGEATADLLRGGLTLDGVELQVQGNQINVQTPLVIALEGAQVRVSPTRLTGQGLDLSLGGELGLRENAQMNFALNGLVTLSNLPPVGPDVRLDGTVTINNARISGTFAQPNLSGEILLNRIGVLSPDAPAAIEEGVGRIVLSNDKATLESFRARISDGSLEITGASTLANLRFTEWKYDVKVANVDILYQEVRATISGAFALAGTPEGQLLSGRADVTDAEYTAQIDLDGIVTGRNPAPLLSGFSGPGFGTRGPNIPPINLNVHVEARDSLIIRDDEINAVGSASITLSGPLSDPAPTGRVSAEGGSVRFRGQRYEITTATLDLFGGGSAPVLNLQAEGNTSGYRVYIAFAGPIDQIDLSLRSEPQLTREEILSLIATGRTEGTALGGGDLFYTGAGAAGSLITSELTKPLQRELGVLGINRFSIDPVFRPNTNPAARATIAGQLARGLFYNFATDLASEGDRTISLEYSFSNTFSGLMTYSQGGSSSGRGTNSNDFSIEIRGRKRFSLGFSKPSSDPKLATTDPNVTTPPPAVRPRLSADRILVTPIPNLKLGRRTLDDLLPVRTQGFSRSLARLGERRLLNYLQEKGYFFASVGWRCEPADCSGDDFNLTYQVEPGERYKLSDVRFDGAEQLNLGGIESRLQSQTANELAGVPVIRLLPFIGGLQRGITSNERIRQDAETIRRHLVDRGYRNARVNSRYAVTEDSGLVVVFSVESGAQSSVAEVILKGNTLMTVSDLRAVVPIKGGDTFSYTRAATGQQAIRQTYAQRGFLEASAELEVVELAEDRVQLVYHIDEGLQAIVGDIEVTGTTKTKLTFVRRYYDFRTGEVLTPAKIRRTQQDLYATGAFREVALRTELVDSVTGAHRIRLNLTEAKPLLFVYGVGYSTDDGARGLLELTNTNVAGTLDALTLRLRGSNREQFAQLLFTDLRPFGTKMATTTSVFYNRNARLRPSVRPRVIERDADGNERRIDDPGALAFGLQRFAAFIQTERKVGERLSLRFRYNLERANLFNFEQNFPETEVTRNERAVRLGIFSAGITRDTRDNLLSPTQGQLISADHSLAMTGLGGNENYNKFFGQYQRYHTLAPETPVLKDSTLAFSARLGLAAAFRVSDRNGDGVISESERRLPISERFFSGGATTLRGFRFETAGPQGILDRRSSRPHPNDPTKTLFDLPTLVPLGGDAVAIFNFELRYPLTRRMRLVPFYDLGNVFYRVKDLSFGGMANTIGLGLHVNTPLGPIGVDYGFLLDPASFTTNSGAILRQPRGVLHIRFGQTF